MIETSKSELKIQDLAQNFPTISSKTGEQKGSNPSKSEENLTNLNNSKTNTKRETQKK